MEYSTIRETKRLLEKVKNEVGLRVFRSREVNITNSDLQFLVKHNIVSVIATKYEDRLVPRSRYESRYNRNEETVLQDLETNMIYNDLEDLPIGRHFKSIVSDKKLVKDCSYNVYQLQFTDLQTLYQKEFNSFQRKWADFI